jgi:hypothetical protein
MERPRAFSRSKGTGLTGLNPELFMMVVVVVVVALMIMMITIYRVRKKRLAGFEMK